VVQATNVVRQPRRFIYLRLSALSYKSNLGVYYILTAYKIAMTSVVVSAHSWSPLVPNAPVNTINRVAKE
jgi:hypothetical protein